MKTISLYLSACLVAIILNSCSIDSKTSDLAIIDPEEIIQHPIDLKMSEFISDIEYVKLENHPDGLIGKIGIVIPAKDFLITAGFDQPLFQFKSNGEFVRQVGGVGKGPGEYSNSLKYFWVDQSDEILIWDQRSRQMIFYNLNGEWTRSIKAPHYFSTFVPLNAEEFLGYTTNPPETSDQLSQYMILDTKGNMEYLIVPENIDYTKRIRAPFRPEVAIINKQSYLKPAFSDTIYKLEKHNIVPFMLIELGQNRVPNEIIYDIRKYHSDLRNYSFFSTMNECADKWLIVTVHHRGDWVTGLVDIENRRQIQLLKNYSGPTYGILNDVDGGGNWFNDILLGNKYYTCNSADWMIKNMEDGTFFIKNEAKYIDKSQKLKELISDLNLEDNPVVQIMTLK